MANRSTVVWPHCARVRSHPCVAGIAAARMDVSVGTHCPRCRAGCHPGLRGGNKAGRSCFLFAIQLDRAEFLLALPDPLVDAPCGSKNNRARSMVAMVHVLSHRSAVDCARGRAVLFLDRADLYSTS